MNKLKNIEFNKEDVNISSYAKEIINAYSNNERKIAEYMIKDNNFTSFYPNISLDVLINSLKEPEIRILDNNSGVLSYCNHTLDNEHVISLEFKGLFEELYYLSIDG